jgi:hypothetical protein
LRVFPTPRISPSANSVPTPTSVPTITAVAIDFQLNDVSSLSIDAVTAPPVDPAVP